MIWLQSVLTARSHQLPSVYPTVSSQMRLLVILGMYSLTQNRIPFPSPLPIEIWPRLPPQPGITASSSALYSTTPTFLVMCLSLYSFTWLDWKLLEGSYNVLMQVYTSHGVLKSSCKYLVLGKYLLNWAELLHNLWLRLGGFWVCLCHWVDLRKGNLIPLRSKGGEFPYEGQYQGESK